jgi:arylsulfatase A-like enzyme
MKPPALLMALRVAVRDGLVGGLLMGAVHTGLLAVAGLYATAGPSRILASLLRWMGLLGLLGGLAAAAGLVLRGLLPRLDAPQRRERRQLGLIPAALYLGAWAVVLGHGALPPGADGREALIAAAAATGLAALGSLLLAAGLLPLPRPPWPPTPQLHEGERSGAGGIATLLWTVLAVLFVVAPGLLPAPRPAIGDHELQRPSSPALEAAAEEAFAGPRRNLLLITVDTLRADHLGCYGYQRDTSPAIDGLARRGVRMDQAICPRPTTSPSFATFFTGAYPMRHGVNFTQQVLAPENLTLAEILKDAGYATAAVITNPNLFPAFGFDQGFTTYVHGHTRAGEGRQRALDWLENDRPDDRPWFFWFHSTDPHYPYNPLPPYNAMFSQSDTTGSVQRQIELYDGEIRYTDDELAQVLQYFYDRPALWANTLTVFAADHGESLDEHDYYFQHGELPYEQTARIPLLFVAPGVLPAGAVSPALVTGADLLPTLLSALQVSIPGGIHGVSCLPVLLGLDDRGPHDFVFLEAGFGEHIRLGRTRSLRRVDTKYVQRLTRWAQLPDSPSSLPWSINAWLEGGLQPDEFYDLTTDPQEAVNLLGRDPARDARERALLEAFQRRLAASGQIRAGQKAELDPATLESLRSLGYIQ